MALHDILAVEGDGQDFVIEIPSGNSGYFPSDILIGSEGTLQCVEIPEAAGGGDNIFIISE